MAVGTRAEPVTARRLQSLDVMRGVAMVPMAIDHVRVYSGVPAGGPSPGVFFTRWVTHFCAPAFVFFRRHVRVPPREGRHVGPPSVDQRVATL